MRTVQASGGRRGGGGGRGLQVLQRRGAAVAYLGGSSSVVVAGGLGGRGVNVALWDTQAPPQTSCVATLLHHQARLRRPCFTEDLQPCRSSGPRYSGVLCSTEWESLPAFFPIDRSSPIIPLACLRVRS